MMAESPCLSRERDAGSAELDVPWTKSSYCSSGACVQVASQGTKVLLRDSKDPAACPLQFTIEEWQAFVAGVKDGEFDLIGNSDTA